MQKANDPENPEMTSGRNISYWTDTVENQPLHPLQHDHETDTVIVGGGLAGMTTAYCLALSGRAVIVVEDGQIGSGESGRTTAQLCTALDDRYYNFVKTFGVDKARAIAHSHATSIDFVEKTIAAEDIDCEFTRLNGYLFLHPSDKADALDREFEAAAKAGVSISRTDAMPGMSKPQSGLVFANQAQFHPLKYLAGLKKAILARGGQIFTGTHAAKISQTGITTSTGFTINAKNVVVATNAPVNSMFMLPIKQFAYRTYVIAGLVKKGLLPKALWWDTGDYDADHDVAPYHYVRIEEYNEEYDLLISGGEDHPTGDTSDTDIPEQSRYEALEKWTRYYFPIEGILYHWSGQVMEPMDGVAFIGRNPFDHDNVYIITGDSGNGMTHCTIGGMLIADLVNGKANPWEKIYSPSRFTFSESGIVFKRMFAEIMSYFRQQPNFKTAKELASVKNGEGRIVDMLEEKFGVYRDINGGLHIVSAECTHMKCTVHWNADEKSWDCPCHGSRFTYEGKVTNGPANRDLPWFDENAHQNAG
jgi:glycine/D-amino acid oxidase-like deaminating enzyme/nitrite reductase/ring-hydroxylating ferredoxin subunit